MTSAPPSISPHGIPVANGRLYELDNLLLLKELPESHIQMIYCDPPYCSGRNYLFQSPSERVNVFSDIWPGGTNEYLAWILPRLREMRRLLNPLGVLLVHVDWRISHAMKLLLDHVFGEQHFICEFIWRMFTPHLTKGKLSPAKMHQSILAYSRTIDDFTYFPQYIPYRDYYLKRARTDPDGRLWVDQNLGGITPSAIETLQHRRRLFTTRSGKTRRKQYLDEMPGQVVGTVISHIERLNSQSGERTGYETQKPEALLDLFIKMFTKKKDLTADFFCGSGTLPVVAERLGRQWIACDSNPIAIKVTLERLKSVFSGSLLNEKILPK